MTVKSVKPLISDEVMHSPRMGRFSFLIGNPLRTPAEEEEMLALRRELSAEGNDPGWLPNSAAKSITWYVGIRDVKAIDRMVFLLRRDGKTYRQIFEMVREERPKLTLAEWDALLEKKR